mmetsp:Transcript_63849/g.164338  ORF Transcript_63849/g.164338 Transcript_63849/m.164338 type:complete len:302 (-) Transcript_63849:743-1648(-)
MCTSRVWPMRCTRWMACSSTAGFHQRSSMYRREAATRLRPTPPALSETSSTRPDAAPSTYGSESHATFACRWSRLREPLNCCEGMPSASSALPTRSRKDVHCEKTTARRPASMSPRSSFSSCFIFVLTARPGPSAWPPATPAPPFFARRRAGMRDAPGSTLSDLRLSAPARRQTGHSLMLFMAALAHSRQKMCPQGVIAGSSGGSQQMGQSGRVPLRKSSNRFPTNSSDMPSLPSISLRHRCSRLCMSSSVAPSRAKTRKGWQRACRSLRISCRMCVYLESTLPDATRVSNCVCAFLYSAV